MVEIQVNKEKFYFKKGLIIRLDDPIYDLIVIEPRFDQKTEELLLNSIDGSLTLPSWLKRFLNEKENFSVKIYTDINDNKKLFVLN